MATEKIIQSIRRGRTSGLPVVLALCLVGSPAVGSDQHVESFEVYARATRPTGRTVCPAESLHECGLIPEPPAFEVGKRPVDVFQHWLACLKCVPGIAPSAEVPMLDLTIDRPFVFARPDWLEQDAVE